MISKTAAVIALVVCLAFMVACSDRYRVPCGVATVTTVRTKNKALGWTPSSVANYPNSEFADSPRIVDKCS